MVGLLPRVLKQWLPLAVGITVVSLLLYASVQQVIRQSANDPQIQMAEDMAARLQAGEQVKLPGMIDVSRSLAPFTILYDKQGNVVNSSGELHGKTPELPQGALTGQKDSSIPGENRITWQPQGGVRLATVIVSYDNGYVLVGRNMREIEIRESEQVSRIMLGWLFSLACTLVTVFLVQLVFHKVK